ncbi:MAG: YCF48-related protein [bacterium]
MRSLYFRNFFENIMKYFIIILIFILSLLPSRNYAQWINHTPDINDDIFSIYFLNENTGFALGVTFTIFKTTDSGDNWNQIFNNIHDVIDITFINDSIGFVCGDNGVIFKTTNGGYNWSQFNTGVGYYLYSLYFINSSTGFCAGERTIFKTTDTGQSWIPTNFNNNFYSIQFVNSETGFATGDRTYKTTNSGIDWNILNTPTGFYSVDFLDAATGFICGQVGKIYKTTDSGNNWMMLSTNTNTTLYSITFTSIDTGYAVGNTIIKTTNAGENWFFQNSSTFNYSYSVHMLNNMTGFIGGGSNSGYILKTTNGGGAPIGIQSNFTMVPESFSLSQNYPNPFNPKTVINYKLGITNYVSLKVFDALGKEISTLVNENQNPGSYSVEWDAVNYPSGIYFYRLESEGKIIDTKRMVLLK